MLQTATRVSKKFILILVAVFLITHWATDWPETKAEYLARGDGFSLGVYLKDDFGDFIEHVKNPLKFFEKGLDYDAMRMTEVNQIAGVVDMYFNDKGSCPESLKRIWCVD